MNKNILIMAILLLSLFSFSCTGFTGIFTHVKDLYGNGDQCVYIEENGKYVPFLVIDNNYSGNVLLLRKEPLEQPMTFNSYSSQYENSIIDQYLNTEYIASLTDRKLQIEDSEITITADESIGITEQETVSIIRKVFLLSYTELGFDDSYNAAHEGKPLKYFKKPERRTAFVNGNEEGWWLRTPDTYYSSCVYYIGKNNTIEIANAYDENYVRPAFCISADTPIEARNGILSEKAVYTLSE